MFLAAWRRWRLNRRRARLQRRLRHPDPVERVHAVREVLAAGFPDPSAVLLPALQNSDALVREAVVLELPQAGIPDATTHLLPLLRDPIPRVREVARQTHVALKGDQLALLISDLGGPDLK